jgi:protein phosphatase
MDLEFRSCARTHVGLKRTNNEDSHFADDDLGLYVVADGMGGHAAGEVASAEAIDQIVGMIKGDIDKIEALAAHPSEENRQAVRRLLESAIQMATYFVHGMAELQPDKEGMGTTISAIAIAGNLAVVGQVGDSRVYCQRHGVMIQLTEDHTLVNLKVKRGEITPEEAAKATYKNVITRAVGIADYVEVDTFDVQIQPGDRYLLCSDGLHDYADQPSDLAAVTRNTDLVTAAEGLINFGLSSGGKDNITVVLIDALDANPP